MKINGERLWDLITELGEKNRSHNGGINRPAFSQADREAIDTVIKWMKEANLNIRVDAMGNVFGRREGTQKSPVVLTGSHIDAVPNGGMFDGVAGVISSLEVMQTLDENNIKTTLPVEMVVFVNEEGSRFPGGTMGSRAVIGELSEDVPYETLDDHGETLYSAMIKYGAKPDNILEAKRSPHEFHSFIELHIEQGKVLENLAKPIGVVTSISGTRRLHVKISGKSGHAGVTPMDARHDPMVAAAIVIKEIEKIATETSPLTRSTVGYIKALPGGVNVIPSAVEFSVDIRDTDQENIEKATDRIKHNIKSNCKQRKLECEITETQNSEPTLMSVDIREKLKGFAQELKIPTTELTSGAGHDAAVMATVCPSGMIFVRSKDGLSHCPEEYSSKEDLELGAQLLLTVVKNTATL